MELTEWIEEVRRLLYEVAHQENELGARAECLGSFIPGLLEETDKYTNLESKSEILFEKA